MRFPLYLALLGGALSVPASAQQFIRDAAAIPAQTVWTDGVQLADVDGDGDMDILFANGSSYGGGGTQGSQPQHLYLNNGSGVFSASHGDLNVSNFNAKQVIAEDFDGDGDLDLYYCSGSLGFRPRLLINQGGAQAGTQGIFVDRTVAQTPNLSLRSFGIAAGDIDADGDMDVTISDGGTFGGFASQLRMLENDGSGNFTEITGQLPTDTYNCQDITMFDYDGDFDVDIALSGKGANGKRGRLYLNDGTGNFSISNAMNGLGSGNTYEIEWGDLDGDGDFDGAVQSIGGPGNTSEGWARNDGPNATLPEFIFPTPNGQDDNELAMVDYDNDGDLDVFVASLSTTEKIYRNDGGGVFVNQQGQISNQNDSSLDFAFADLDGDNDYDMVTAQGESGNFTNKIYDNNGGPDTLGPIFVSNNGVANTTFVQLSDQVSDDGQLLVTLAATYSSNMGSGAMAVTRMGGGLFLAQAPSTPGLVVSGIDFTATDSVGNTSDLSIPDTAFEFNGAGKAGVNGIPTLTGTGSLVPGTTATISLTDGPTGVVSTAVLFVSTTRNPIPFKAGILYANPADVLVSFLNLPATGELDLSSPWPPGAPSGFELFWQYAIQDFGIIAPQVSLSNAIKSTQP